MSNVWGYGTTWTGVLVPILPTTPGFGVEVGRATGSVRDIDGTWYRYETWYYGGAVSLAPVDVSLDGFVLQSGRSVREIEGTGYVVNTGAVTSVGVLLNADGQPIGVTSGFFTNIGVGAYRTETTLTRIPPEDLTQMPTTALEFGLGRFGGLNGSECFPAETLITLSDGRQVSIEQIKIGDVVLAFDGETDCGRGTLMPRRVTRLFQSTTDEWVVLRPASPTSAFRKLIVTPGHHFLASDGTFRTIDEILSLDSTIVLVGGEALEVRAERISYSEENAHLFDQADRLCTRTMGALAVAPEWRKGWRTYNFEVEDLHTYVAEGVRVHNHSILRFVPEGSLLRDVVPDANGTPRSAVYVRSDGIEVAVSGLEDANGNTTRLFEAYTVDPTDNVANGAEIQVLRQFDPTTGAETSRDVTGFRLGATTLDLGTVGNILGSQVGAALGGNSVTGQILAGTIVGTIAQNVGQFLQNAATFALTDFTFSDNVTGALSTSPLANAADLAFRDFGLELVGNLKGQVVGQISSMLMAELADALDIRDPFASGVFTAVGTTITSQLLSNVSGMVLNAAGVPGYGAVTLLTGFNPINIAASISSAVFGYLGNHLAGKVIVPETQEGALGASIGGAIGAFVGNWLLGPIGSGIGSFIGNVVGTAVGDSVGNDVESWGAVTFDPATGEFVATGFGGKHGGDPAMFSDVAHSQADYINGLLHDLGLRVDQYNSAISPLHYFQKGTSYRVTQPDFSAYEVSTNPHAPFYRPGSEIPKHLTREGAAMLLRDINVIGGDVVVRRAFEASSILSPGALAGDLAIAQDYRRYLDNHEIINVLIAADPDSVFAAGWVATLLRAEELGLNRGSADDFRGGILANFAGRGLDDKLDWVPDLDLNEPDTLLLRKLNHTVAIDNAFGPGLVERGSGTAENNGADYQHVSAGTVVRHDSGAGNDGTTGHGGTDILVGGAGDDSMDGREGHDWLHGGDGNDWLYGGTGDDLVVGGTGDDTLYGVGGFDVLVGGDGSDLVLIDGLERHETVVAATTGSTSQNDVVRIAAAGIDTSTGATLYARVGADLVVSPRTGYWDWVDTTSNPEHPTAELRFTETGRGTVTIQDFFLTRSGVDAIEFTAQGVTKTADELWAAHRPTAYVTESTRQADGTEKQLYWFGPQDGAVSLASFFEVHGNALTLIRQTAYYANGGSHTLYGDGANEIYADAAGRTWDGLGGNDTIGGSDGADTLIGGTGIDRLIGAGGDDSYYVDAGGVAGDVVIEHAGQGHDRIYASVNYVLTADVEDLVLTGDAWVGFGNELGNVLAGGAADDALYGYGGADTLIGGAGYDTLGGGASDDLYLVDSPWDVVTEYAQQGTDTVYASATFALGADVENLALTGGARVGSGNALANALTGTAGDDALYGYGGSDTLIGGAGADALAGGGDNDLIYGQEGADLLYGSSGGDRLEGGDGNDRLFGESGNDTLVGGAGSDAAGLSGGRSDYAVAYAAATQTFTFTDRRAGAPDGTDLLTGIERLELADGRGEIIVDQPNATDWAFYIDFYNAGGARTYRDGRFDDGGTWRTTFDTWGAEWTQYIDYYDASGAHTRRDGVFDDGGTWRTTYDLWGANWNYYIDYFNASGVHTHQHGVYDNGATWDYYW